MTTRPIAAVLLTVLTLVAGPSAEARWVDPGMLPDLSEAGRSATSPAIDTGWDGTTAAAWRRFDGRDWRIQVAVRAPGGAFTAPMIVSASGQDAMDPHVAVHPSGRVFVVWRRFDGSHWRIQQANAVPGTSFGTPSNLSDAGQHAESPDIDTGKDGTTVVAWRRFDGSRFRTQARIRPPVGGFGPVQTLSAAGRDAHEPRVAVAPDGSSTVVWRRASRIQASRATPPPGMAFGAAETLSASGESAWSPDIDAGDDGTTAVVWQRTDSPGARIQARVARTFGPFGAERTLSAAGQDTSDPHVAVGPDGTAHAVWTRFDGANDRIEYSSAAPGAHFTAPVTLSAAGQNAERAQLDTGKNGKTAAVWRRWDGHHFRIQSRVRASDATAFGAVQTLSDAGQDAQSAQVSVADGPLVLWRRSDGSHERIQVAYLRGADGDESLSDPSLSASHPHIATGSGGTTVAVWVASVGVQATVAGPGEPFGPVQTLTHETLHETLHSGYPRVAVGPDGSATIVWMGSDGANDRVIMAMRSAGGKFGSARAISAAGRDAMMLPEVAAGSDGTTVVVWGDSDGTDLRVVARVRPAGGSLGPARALSAPGTFATSPRVGVGASGQAYAVWATMGDPGNNRIQMSARPAGGRFRAPVNLSAAGTDGVELPRLAVGEDGDVAVAWIMRDSDGVSRVQARVRPAGGGFGGVATLSAAGHVAWDPHVAIAPDGGVRAVWEEHDGSNSRIQHSARPAGGAFAPAAPLSPAGEDVSQPRLATGLDGTSIVLWNRVVDRNSWDLRVQARVARPGRPFGPASRLTGQAEAADPEVAVSPDGSAYAVWSNHEVVEGAWFEP